MLLLFPPKTSLILLRIFTLLLFFAIDIGASNFLKDHLVYRIVESYSTQEENIATQIGQILDTEVTTLTNELFLLAQVDDLRNGNTSTCNNKLKEIYPALKSHVENVGRMNANGVFYCSLNKDIIGIRGEALGHYLKEIVDDPEHKPVMSRVIKIPSKIPFEDIYAIAIHVPVYDENHVFTGTIGGAIYLNKLQEKYFAKVNLLKGGYVILIDDNGDVLYHPKLYTIAKSLWSEEIQDISGHNNAFNVSVLAGIGGKSQIHTYPSIQGEKIASFHAVDIYRDRRWVAIVTTPIDSVKKALIDETLEKRFRLIYVLNGFFLIVIFGSFLFYKKFRDKIMPKE